jgi:predicted NAD/FAD-binding protein
MNSLLWLHYIATFICILFLSIYTYIKSRIFGNNKRVPPLHNRENKIAIIGGGIGGVSAAYALLRSGYTNVTIYEACDKLGGNAKTHVWQCDNTSITTGISVLAWPVIFRNYIHLLKELNLATTTVKLPFFIHNKEENSFFAHGKQHIHTQQYNNDLKRWNRMVNTVRYVADFFNGKEASLYHFTILNPFNYISMRFLSLLFGVSNRFWNNIVVPMYASSFLSTKLSFIPSSVLPTIDSLISLQPNRIPIMQTWVKTSIDVFDEMTRGALIKTNHRINNVHIQRKENNQIKISINNEKIVYDRIIFACNANAIVSALMNGHTKISLL